MPSYSPELYQTKYKIILDLPPLERKAHRCMAYIAQRGGFDRRDVRFHNKKFPINNNGVTPAGAIAEGVHNRFILIHNDFKKDAYPEATQ